MTLVNYKKMYLKLASAAADASEYIDKLQAELMDTRINLARAQRECEKLYIADGEPDESDNNLDSQT